MAYHDLTLGNQGGLYRTDVDVDIISPSAGVYAVNNFQTGEWLEYTINVADSGTYRLEASVSSEFSTSALHFEIDRANVTGTVPLPNTGSWWSYQWVGKSGVSLTAGTHILRIHSDQEYFNLDSIQILAENIPAPVSSVQDVVWTNLINATASGNSLQKTSGCDGCDDGGAISQQQLTGDGYVEFTASETSLLRYVGLSNTIVGTGYAEIDFAVALGWGFVEVREKGLYKAGATAAPGDLFRIAVESGVVKYYQNGALLYTSAVAPTYPLVLDASLFNLNGTITNAVIFGGSSAP